MKILLLEHPRSVAPERCNDIANTPLSSCLLSGYAAAMLKGRGHEVEIVEGYLDKLSYGDIADKVNAMKPDILGVHLVYHWQNDHALFDFLDTIKREGQVSTVTAYGFYATISYNNILKDRQSVDSVIVGESERPFAELVEAVSFKNYTPAVPGLAIRDGLRRGQTSRTGTRSRPRQSPFSRSNRGIEPPFRGEPAGKPRVLREVHVLLHQFFLREGKPLAREKSRDIAREVDEIIADRGTRDFYFTDPNFFGPGQMGQDRALRIATLLKPQNIRFGIEGRVNDIRDETIAALVDAGLRQILIGLESGKDESLRRMNKMTTVAQNENALRILRKHGIEPNVGFIMLSRIHHCRMCASIWNF